MLFRSTPLLLATTNDKPDVVSFLVSKNANVNAVDNSGRTPLHIASQKGLISCIQALKCQRLKCNAKDRNRATALHLAAAVSQIEAAEILINDMKVDALLVDNQNRTPLHIVFHLKCTAIVNIINAACPAASSIISELEEQGDDLALIYPKPAREDVEGAKSSEKSNEVEGLNELESPIPGFLCIYDIY